MKQILLFIIMLFFIGCGPKYVINKEYVAPQGDGSAACITVCEQEKVDCEFRCNSSYETCMNRAGSRANIRYQKALNSYENAYATYKHELRRYSKRRDLYEYKRRATEKDYYFFQKQCKKQKDRYACKREKETFHSLKQLKHMLLPKPLAPRAPVFNRVLQQEQRQCRNQCGCLIQFDSCYSRCGGKVLFHKECVDGCE